jgi:capsular polysaccharide transport system permease protein
MTDFMRSFDLQMRVIAALFMRELQTRFGKENIGILWIVVEPTMFCVGVSIMWSLLRIDEHGAKVTPFIITGYSALTLWRHCVGRSIKAFESNGALLFHRQVTTLDIIFARLCTDFLGSTVSFTITGGAAVLLGLSEPPKDWGLLYAGWLYVALFSAGSGLLFAGLSELSDVVEKVIPVSMYLSIPLSGCFTMVDWLPQNFQWALLLSPSVNAFEMIRGGWFGPEIRPHYDVTYLTWTCLLQLLLGLYVVRRARAYILVL